MLVGLRLEICETNCDRNSIGEEKQYLRAHGDANELKIRIIHYTLNMNESVEASARLTRMKYSIFR